MNLKLKQAEEMKEQRRKLEQQLVEKALKDDQFRQQLVSFPKETISREFGISLPDSFDIEILQEDAATFYLVLPWMPVQEDSNELSEAELQQVSGGSFFDTQCSTWSWIFTQCDAC